MTVTQMFSGPVRRCQSGAKSDVNGDLNARPMLRSPPHSWIKRSVLSPRGGCSSAPFKAAGRTPSQICGPALKLAVVMAQARKPRRLPFTQPGQVTRFTTDHMAVFASAEALH